MYNKNKNKVDYFVDCIHKSEIIALDFEGKEFQIVQIANDLGQIFVVDYKLLLEDERMNKCMIKVLNNKKVVKVGQGVKQELQKIKYDMKIVRKVQFYDLMELFKLCYPEETKCSLQY